MLKISTITNSPYQTAIFKLENGQPLLFTLRYSYQQQGWYFSFTYGSYTINNRRMVNSANMLRQIINVIPFGLACLMTDLYEPVFIDDFKNGRAVLYTLNSEDVALVETDFMNLKLMKAP